MRILLSILLTLTGCTGSFPVSSGKPAPAVFPDPMLKAIDGDTVFLKLENRYGNLACIDAPEPEQDPWGVIAARRLAELVKNPSLEIKVVKTNMFKVSDLIIKDSNGMIQARLVEEGLALVLPNCILSEDLKEYEDNAKGKGAGVWSDREFINPADFRKNKVTTY